MKIKIISFSVSLIVIVFIVSSLIGNYKSQSSNPTPIEFVTKKKKRKELKKYRKDWIENMHKSHSNDNWKEIDRETRKINSGKILSLRKQVINTSREEDFLNNYKVRLSRNIQGEWIERGSNNLAGRIRTADIDFNNGVIYCASSGGNIWRGSLNGENWESLNDYMQILGITFLRIVNTNSNQRLLIGSENDGFYFSDNEGFTLNESSGIKVIILKDLLCSQALIIFTHLLILLQGLYIDLQI